MRNPPCTFTVESFPHAISGPLADFSDTPPFASVGEGGRSDRMARPCVATPIERKGGADDDNDGDADGMFLIWAFYVSGLYSHGISDFSGNVVRKKIW